MHRRSISVAFGEIRYTDNDQFGIAVYVVICARSLLGRSDVYFDSPLKVSQPKLLRATADRRCLNLGGKIYPQVFGCSQATLFDAFDMLRIDFFFVFQRGFDLLAVALHRGTDGGECI